jgi:glucose uptake protein GlcU
MGKYVFFGVVAFLVIIIGMLLYPTIHTNYASIDVTGFTALEKAGMAILSYAFIFFFIYLVYAHIKK